LSNNNRVTVCIGHGPRQVLNVLLGVLHAQLVFCWFASVYAAIAILFAGILGKKSIVVIGGVDVAKEKEFGYGLWLSPWKSVLVGRAIKKASRVLVVDQSLRDEVLQRVKYPGNNIEVLSTGFDHAFWRPSGEKEPLVLTVAAIQSNGRLKIKGIDILFEVARTLPQTKFVLIGFDSEKFHNLIPPTNLTLFPVLDREELLRFYQRAKVYCQPSRREGLSNTLCEAILCGCYPVVTDVGGSARAVGTYGIVVPPDNPAALAAAILRAFEFPEHTDQKARERIIEFFPRQKREIRLNGLIQGINP
jgi:glycosyltransferase involved in cell wall biosynthesis